MNPGLVEEDGVVGGSRLAYPGAGPAGPAAEDRARSQLSAVSKINIPGAVSYK